MANTKISQLPSYTGTAADIRWFVMNNSVETETYKYSGYTGLLIPGTGVDSIVSSSALTPTYGPNPISSGLASIAIGSSNTEASANFALALGWNCRATAGGAMALGVSNTANGNQACVIGYASSAGGTDSFCGGVESNSGGFRSVAIGKYAAATGGESVAIGNAISSEASYGTTLGGIQLIRNSQYSSIVGGRNQTIITNTSYNNIFGASDSDIRTNNGSGGFNNIIGGRLNYISGNTSGATLIGLSGYTDANINDCAYVNNLQVLRTPSTRVQSVSSGTTFTCNLDNGAKSQFYITGTSTINITNVRDGASFMIKTQTDGNHTMTWTATGYTFVFTGGLKDPGNNVTDIFVFEVFGSVIYGNRRHNYS